MDIKELRESVKWAAENHNKKDDDMAGTAGFYDLAFNIAAIERDDERQDAIYQALIMVGSEIILKEGIPL